MVSVVGIGKRGALLKSVPYFLCAFEAVCCLPSLLRNFWRVWKRFRCARVENSRAAVRVAISRPVGAPGSNSPITGAIRRATTLRYIDWKLYCRTDRHYIKLFQEEEDLYTYLFLDLSASMGYPASDEKYAAARDVSLALAYVVLASDDAVKMHALTSDAAEHATPFFRGRRRFFSAGQFFLMT